MILKMVKKIQPRIKYVYVKFPTQLEDGSWAMFEWLWALKNIVDTEGGIIWFYFRTKEEAEEF